MTGRVRSVLTGRCPASGHNLNTGFRGELTGASGHPAEAHNGPFFSRCYKYFLHSCVGVLLLIPIAEKHCRVPPSLFTLSIYLSNSILVIYIPRIAMLEWDWNLDCKTFVR